MDKPTPEEIIAYVKETQYRKPMKVVTFESIESFTLVYQFKCDARPACDLINRKFGYWVYAMIHDDWKHPHVSIGYRSRELSTAFQWGVDKIESVPEVKE